MITNKVLFFHGARSSLIKYNLFGLDFILPVTFGAVDMCAIFLP